LKLLLLTKLDFQIWTSHSRTDATKKMNGHHPHYQTLKIFSANSVKLFMASKLNMITVEQQSRGSPHVVLRVRPGHLTCQVRSSNFTDLPVPRRLALGSPLCTFTSSPSNRPAASPHNSDTRHELPNISPSHRPMAEVSVGWRSFLRVHLQGDVEPPPALWSQAVLLALP
jgi:hypothetical protein